MISRRSFLGSMLAIGVAPAIVRATSIMRVKPLVPAGWVFDEPSGIAIVRGGAFTSFAQLSDEDKRWWAEQIWRKARDNVFKTHFVTGRFA